MSNLVNVSTTSRDMQILQYLCVSVLTLSVYQYLLTLDHEIKYLWSKRMSLQKIVFLANRYLPIITSPIFTCLTFLPHIGILESCTFILCIAATLIFINIVIASGIFTLRLMIIWMHNRLVKVLIIIAGVLISFIIITIYTIIVSDGLYSKTVPTSQCIPTGTSAWIPIIVVLIGESTFVCLAIYKRVKTLKNERVHLLNILINDGVIYYAYKFTLVLAITILHFVFEETTIAGGLVKVDAILHSIISSHLSFHLHNAAGKTVVEASSPGSNIQFV
ncbi:hypothetical protein PNOK_0870500 [Pyrrhoderma noxium]|uniref:DUF6533 domain-containing protein n=1 Tax=Pyrrhoderma noxium TaxID=2282107 RepID=A0A286U8B3_9AGAM|nr:hypothetical protein PNOK_0870500 [Pyrrhoderma noxium]